MLIMFPKRGRRALSANMQEVCRAATTAFSSCKQTENPAKPILPPLRPQALPGPGDIRQGLFPVLSVTVPEKRPGTRTERRRQTRPNDHTINGSNTPPPPSPPPTDPTPSLPIHHFSLTLRDQHLFSSSLLSNLPTSQYDPLNSASFYFLLFLFLSLFFFS